MNHLTNRARTLGGLALGLALAVVLALGLYLAPLARADADLPSGTVVGSTDRTMYSATALSSSGTVYSPATVSGENVTLTRYYHAGEAFVTIDLATTGTVTVTAQSSTDQTNWADAYTVGDTGTSIPVWVVLTADGTNYMRIPFAGYYTRFKIQHTASVTPTIRMVLRNNGGS